MKKLAETGRIIFGLGFLGEGFVCILSKNFVVGRPPGWAIESHPLLAYITGVVLIICGAAIIVNKFADVAALVVVLMILIFTIPGHLMHFMDDWVNAYKSFALLGGAIAVLIADIQGGNSRIKPKETVRHTLLLISLIFVAAFFIVAGYAHFKYADFVKDLIPEFIPFHLFWTYFCGVCLLAGGIGILIPKTRWLASLLSGIMVMGWFLLLHIPRFLANPQDPSDRLGVLESFAFAGVFFLFAALSKTSANSVNYSQLGLRPDK